MLKETYSLPLTDDCNRTKPGASGLGILPWQCPLMDALGEYTRQRTLECHGEAPASFLGWETT